ncbi:MAG: protein phosphatase 2C domain-containing protein, partial [Chlamydiota bacterium]
MRSNNEDSWKILEEKQFFVLADGVGGHNAGEVASTIAVESLCSSMQSLPEQPSVEEACLYLRRAVGVANAQILEKAKSDPLCKGMGTTLSCYLVLGKFLIYAHVGDSRLYRLRSELRQLTEDHSLRQQARSGTAIAAPRNIITRALGTSAIVHPD